MYRYAATSARMQKGRAAAAAAVAAAAAAAAAMLIAPDGALAASS